VSMGLVLDDEGRDQQMSLMDYFAPITQDVLALPGLPGVRCVSRRHVGRLENFGLDIDGGVYYSGDTVELPPPGPALIFQDCQFFEGGPGTVHISYQRLSQELSPEVKARTHLVHLGGGWDTVDVVADGFAGIVRPGDRFVIPLSAADPEAAR